MDQKKTGLFLKELRKEKKLTQEQLAEQFNVSDRTVSRWETGTNMPDLSILIEIADFYHVDIREIIDGERRSENMNNDVKETLIKVADYTNTEKEKKKRKLNRYFMIGLLCIAAVILDRKFNFLSYIFVGNIPEFVRGALCGLGIVFELIGFYNNNHDVSLKQRKMALIKSKIRSS
ncbi:MAG: helix-turn-helix transcriptional regulator [Bacillota bacterium]|nr:helix-turn-helix transcriptional regulator [Bacillota bacterium]